MLVLYVWCIFWFTAVFVFHWLMFDFSFILSVHLADNQLVYLERKVRMLEQEKTSETTEGTFTNLNHPSNAFDRSEVLDLLQALLHLASTQANQKAKEYAAGLDKVLARWDSLSSPDLQRQERFNHIQHVWSGTPWPSSSKAWDPLWARTMLQIWGH